MIELAGLRQHYDGREVLALAQFRAAAGERWAVVGPSGCGKSTLLHLIAGLLRPSEGSIAVDGTDLGSLAGSALDAFRGRRIGIVPQRLHLIPSLTTAQNLALALKLAGAPADPDRVLSVIERLALAHRAHALPQMLSQGEAQRVAVARAVMNRPKVLLADEPTANLDDANALEALRLLETEAESCNATLVIATHDQRVRTRFERILDLARPRMKFDPQS